MIYPPYIPLASQYKTALRAIRNSMSDKQVALLQAQYNAPNRTITAPQLAQATGINSFSTVNLQYGSLGHLLCNALSFVPNCRADGTYLWWSILGAGISSTPEHGFQWVMHDQLAQALEELGWVSDEQFFLPEEITMAEVFKEGATCQVTINAYERNSRARRKCIEHYGTSCVVCGFNFGRTFGKAGEGIIHVHHLRPLSEIGAEYEVDPIADLRPVCPNCHAIIHSRIPAYNLEEIRVFLG